LQLFLLWDEGCRLSGFSDFLFCSQGVLVGFLEMKVFFYKNYLPQVAVTNFSLSAGASGTWNNDVLDDAKASHLAGAMWNGFDIFRCRTSGRRKLITDKTAVTAESSLDALFRMLEQCRDSLSLRLAALTLEPSDKNRKGGKNKGKDGGGNGKGGGKRGERKGEGGKGKGGGKRGENKGESGKGKDGGGNGKGGGKRGERKGDAGKTKSALQPVLLSTLNILLQNLEQSGEDFNRYF
jgi:hypothetical protein